MSANTCQNCANWDLKGSPEMTKHGYGHCRKDGFVGRYCALSYECDKHSFVLLDKPLLEKRRRYFERGKR